MLDLDRLCLEHQIVSSLSCFRELWTGDLTSPIAIRDLLDLTRTASSLTLKCIGSTSMEATLRLT